MRKLKIVLSLVFCMVSSGVMAHALMLSAQSQRDGIVGQAFYSDGSPAIDERVELFQSPDDKEPLKFVQTGKDGRFHLEQVKVGAYLVVAYGMEGHRAEAAVSVGKDNAADTAFSANDIALLRQDIARLDARIRLADIVGGIGYIVGLAGAYLFWLSRRRNVSGEKDR